MNNKIIYILLKILAGTAITFQRLINGALIKFVKPEYVILWSFITGTVVILGIIIIKRLPVPKFINLVGIPWWYFIGVVTGIIGLISGSGLSVFYVTVNVMPDLAKAANIPPQTISLPVQMMANLIRSVSPVSAIIVIVATTMNISPMKLIKRTAVPIIIGMISVVVLTFITLL